MSWLEPVDQYCERLDASWFSEPLNAASNLAFLIAAWLLYRLYHTAPKPNPAFPLVILIAVVGVGSTLFHVFANKLTMLADVLPIAMFVFMYLWLVLRYLAGCSRLQSAMCLAGFVILAIAAENIPTPYRLNGSVSYAPCLLSLLLLAAYLRHRNRNASRLLLVAAMIFAISLTFRSIDMVLCDAVPSGTHILWHLLNGIVLYLLGKAAMFHARKPSK